MKIRFISMLSEDSDYFLDGVKISGMELMKMSVIEVKKILKEESIETYTKKIEL